MKIDLICSCCGNKRQISNKTMEYTVDAIKEGWGSCGSALYCPDCTKTWKERNGDRPMADERNTFFVIMRQFMNAMREGE